MKKIPLIFSLLSLLTTPLLFSDTIQEEGLTFQIPPSWQVYNTMRNEKGTTIIYLPKEEANTKADEFFGMHSNKFPSNVQDPETLKASLSHQLRVMFQDSDIDLRILEVKNNSVLYSWTAKNNGKEKAHGLGRVFATKDNGTVLLSYQTDNVADTPKIDSYWLPLLKEAKLNN